jgi:hypothetical protein
MTIWILEVGKYGSLRGEFWAACSSVEKAKEYLGTMLFESERVTEWNVDEDGDLDAIIEIDGSESLHAFIIARPLNG